MNDHEHGEERESCTDVTPAVVVWPLSRETLHALVWSEPATSLAPRLGVSSSYVARVCTLLDVPRPARGYWAKLAVGKAPGVLPLPPARPGQPGAWARGDALPEPTRPRPRGRGRSRHVPHAEVSGPGGRHPLVRGAKPLFEAGRLSWTTGYLKPAKKLLVDLAVTESGLGKALSFAN